MQNLHLTVAAVTEHRGRFLMVEERVHGELVINQPAGHVEPGETLVDAVIRETYEETAWHFDPLAISGLYLWEHPTSAEQFLRVVFCGSCHDHEPDQPLDDGIVRSLWLNRDELDARLPDLRSPMVLRAIDDYKNGDRYPVNMFQQLGLQDLASRAAVVRSAA